MESFTKMDIFFGVTTAAIVILTVLLGLITYRIMRFVRMLEGIASEVKDEAGVIRTDLVRLRSDITARASVLGPLASFVATIGKRVVKKKLVRKKS